MHSVPSPRSFALILLLGFGLSSCKTVEKDFKPLPSAKAAEIAPYAMMAANSYHGPKWFPLQSLDWVQIDRAGIETNEATYSRRFSLAFDIFRNDPLHQYAFVYRGTDSVLDFPWANFAPVVSREYLAADWHFRKFVRSLPKPYRDYEVVLVGHSLGAGMALRESVLLGFDAFVFDPSPRLFGPSIPRYKPANRVAVFEKGEILSLVRAKTTSWYKAMNTV
jgi:Lipase (class 3)